MQVFLLSSSFIYSTACLDPSRLGNQVYHECITILRGGWANHPVSKMWKGYRPALAYYGLCGLWELYKRDRRYEKCYRELRCYASEKIVMPPWLGDERLHSSHRAALLLKGVEDATFQLYRGQGGFPLRKGDWDYLDYKSIWSVFGQPEGYYHQFGWKETTAVRGGDGKIPYFWTVSWTPAPD